MSLDKVTHIIFDLDGTLLESETAYTNVLSEIIESYGKKYTPEMKLRIMGTRETETARIAITDLGLPLSTDEFLTIYREKVQVALKEPPLLPGVERLIRHLHNYNIPMAIATSSTIEAYELKTKKYRTLFELMDHVVCGGSDPLVLKGKPEPDIFLVCAERFPDKPPPHKVLVFEDAPNGVLAAKSAGMQCVMVPSTDVPIELTINATLVIESLDDFKPELFGFPGILNETIIVSNK